LKKLKDILENVTIIESTGDMDILIKDITMDSRKIKAGSLFVAIKGTQTDGHEYIASAFEQGAVGVVCEQLPATMDNNKTYIKTSNASAALGYIASSFFDHPSKKLNLTGITGTNGKTTIATILHQVFSDAGYKTGLISTIDVKINNIAVDASLTTPDAVKINSTLDEMVQASCEYCFMEVSSHAIAQNRISGLHFKGGIFTNLSHDHLDYHKTYQEYLNTKKRFFDELPNDAFALINKDDKNGNIMVQNTNAKVYTYALKSMADYKGKIIENHLGEMLISLNNKQLWSHFSGEFNGYNIVAAFGGANLAGLNEMEILKTLSLVRPIPGRFEKIIAKSGITAIIDYAHTPDAIKNVLNNIHKIKNKKSKVITILGAGGNRDKLKRPEMGKAANNQSDILILTSDNPRDEEPEGIIDDILNGITKNKDKILIIPDRYNAIKTACMMAKDKDVILIAGKGHEKYQEIKGERHYFNDKEIANELLN
jgi:UDP-N-acetylmuramoyl-L-alanyl-D-glutamate--2,6-diaminopimelate ligase